MDLWADRPLVENRVNRSQWKTRPGQHYAREEWSDRDHHSGMRLSRAASPPAGQAHPAQVFPVKKVRKPLSAVSLDDALPPCLLAETVEERGQLGARLVQGPETTVQDVDAW